MSAHLQTDDNPYSENTSTAPEQEELNDSYWSALLSVADGSDPVPPPSSKEGKWNGHHAEEGAFDYNEGLPFATEQDWATAKSTYKNDETIELEVTGCNRGGLLVSWNTLRGFVPASQLVDFPVDIDEFERQDMLTDYTERYLNLRIIELDELMNRLILSERAAQVKPGQRADKLASLSPGMTYEGTVTNLCDFGAFIDLGGVEGLIHISELSWGRVRHPRDVLSRDQHVKVYIMSVDSGDERVALSLKRLQPDPWETVEKRYKVGQNVEGIVTNVVDFGAFACIEEGLEGLIHISELAEGQFLHPRNVVEEGHKITARILNIDGGARRLGLSLRQSNDA